MRINWNITINKVEIMILTIPKATPLKAVWNSKLGVGNSGVG